MFALAATMFASPVTAEDFFKFHSANIQYLYGSGHELGDNSRSVISFQYANAWKYGDTYFFIDVTDLDGVYTELHPRFSLSKIFDKKLSAGPIKDIYIATTFEFPEGTNRQLYGFGLDWDIPGFRFFKTNFYKRFNPDLAGSSEQITIAWNRPFKIGEQDFLWDGFADIDTGEGSRVANQHTQTSLLWRCKCMNNKLLTGIEYIYWHNKFGLNDVNESVVQFQIRFEM